MCNHSPFFIFSPPPPPLRRLLEEVLVLKRPAPTLGTVQLAPPAHEVVRGAKDEEELVFEAFEHDGRQERDCEVCKAPGHDGDGGTLDSTGGG